MLWSHRFLDDVQMEQLKSHSRAGQQECQLYSRYSCAFFVSVPIATFSRRPAPAAVSEGIALVIIWPLINGWTDGRTDK